MRSIWLGGVVVIAAVASGCADDSSDLDRESYGKKNLALLRSLPTYPGARPGKVELLPYKANEQSDAIAGYWSSRTDKLPSGTKAGAAVRYYQRELRPDWEVEDISKAPSISMRKGDAYLHVLAGSGEVDVEVDHDCTPGCGGP